MITHLRDAIRRHSEGRAYERNVVRTQIPGMTLVRTSRKGELQAAVQRPLICVVAQGAKQVAVGSETVEFRAGDSMLLTGDAPTLTRIVEASASEPYLSFALDLDSAVVAGLAAEMDPASTAARVGPRSTDAMVADAARRLVALLDCPDDIPILQNQLVREIHYWLLAGHRGQAVRSLAVTDSHASRIGRAVRLIRKDYALPLSVACLAVEAGMSLSTFHQHFRTVTGHSPLQFQKQLRLIEARRLMLSERITPSMAAYAVGYASVPQFSREYRRLFGMPPASEARQALASHGPAQESSGP